MINRTPFIIAEVSGNHGGNRDRMMFMIMQAAICGADAVKFQYYDPEQMPDYVGNERLYKQSYVPDEWLGQMFEIARWCGIPLFASVFAPWSVEHLLKYNPPAFKIASPESTRLPHEVYQAIVGKIRRLSRAELIVSSGLADMAAMSSLMPDCLMYCKAGYPATIEEKDKHIVHWLGSKFPGFSDHTAGIDDTLDMIMAGAKVIEKHFRVTDDAVDAFALDSEQFRLLCDKAHACA